MEQFNKNNTDGTKATITAWLKTNQTGSSLLTLLGIITFIAVGIAIWFFSGWFLSSGTHSTSNATNHLHKHAGSQTQKTTPTNLMKLADSEEQLTENESQSSTPASNKTVNGALTFIQHPPITHYNNYPTYTNSPEAIRARQIYEEVVLKDNYSKELIEEYRKLPKRNNKPSAMKGIQYFLELDRELIEHLMDDVIEELWSTPNIEVDFKSMRKNKSTWAKHIIKSGESDARVYDYLHHITGGEFDFNLNNVIRSSNEAVRARLRANHPDFIKKIDDLNGISLKMIDFSATPLLN